MKPKRIPYKKTPKDPDATITDINRMLRDYDVNKYQWTTEWDLNKVELRMVLYDEQDKPVGIRLRAAPFMANRRTWDAKRGKHIITQAPNWAQSMRLFYYFLKSKLEALAFGLREVKEEFLSDIVAKDANGRETTVGEMAQRMMASGQIRIEALPGGEGHDQ
jgi:hypothetical protein